MTDIKRIAVTAHNFSELSSHIAHRVGQASLIGFDIETAQPRAHDGIKAINSDPRKLVFDVNRTDLCGMSLYPDGSDEAYYLNIGHADVDGRIPWSAVMSLLGCKRPEARWVIHNAQFERTMLKMTVDYDVQQYICTLTMAVSAYGPDEYDPQVFAHRGLGDIEKFVGDMRRAGAGMNQDSPDVQDILRKIVGKESDASHSWNGYVKEMTYGYGLKQAVKSWFGYGMQTYEDTLRGAEHMGQLTTEQVVFYGCDDAIWCMKLYHVLLDYMMRTNPTVVGTYFQQELPMVEYYSAVQREGVRINHEAVRAKQLELRTTFADETRKLKGLVRLLHPFSAEPHAELYEREEWYRKNYKKYRTEITRWAHSPDSTNAFAQAIQLSGAIPKAWAAEKGFAFAKALNLTHYMVTRTLIYDLFQREKLLLEQGKVQSDGDARGRLKESLLKAGKQVQADVLTSLAKLGTIEQAEKLYITPYLKMVDPDTGKLHPVMNSLLATRRMAMSTPNATQLAKRGETVYVRGFYLPDHDDHVIVSIDWSQIELVLMGEFSGDPEYHKCYSRIPYDDLHSIAAAGCLDVSDAIFAALKDPKASVPEHLLINPRGEPLKREAAHKYWRTEVGKGSNFEWIYSGFLANLGRTLGWTHEQTMEVTNRYAARFAGAQEWRMEMRSQVCSTGSLTLPDGHRRVRFEATAAWAEMLRAKFHRWNSAEVTWFADLVIRRLQTRAVNMAINAMIQGTSATLTKRSIQRIHAKLAELGWEKRKVRFMFSVHDELVFSVHRDLVRPFIEMARAVMMDHPDVIKSLLIDCTPSVGLTYQPYSDGTPMGQIELFECPPFDWIPTEFHGKRLPPEHWQAVVDYLFNTRSMKEQTT
ncbi:MAG TPA: DNA polymerase [Rhodopila sp.]|nr:DNA polymerase [Rhodopila sp.]